MFGAYRTLLAMVVVIQHLGGVAKIGTYAVFGFYILSGYLMTYIMQLNYGYSLQGVGKYLLNRVLRIFPLYWASVLLTVGLIVIIGEEYARQYNADMFLPSSPAQFFATIFLFFPFREPPILTPPAWALTVEFFFYICIGLGLSKNKKITICWFFCSLLYHGLIIPTDLSWHYRYYVIPAASLPFATGALIFHFRHELKKYVALIPLQNRGLVLVVLFSLIITNWYIGFLTSRIMSIYFYASYFLNALIIIILAPGDYTPALSAKLDKTLGDYSYPIYLLHSQVGLLLLIILKPINISFGVPSNGLLWYSLPLLALTSWILIKTLEHPIELLRKRVKTVAVATNRRIGPASS